MTRAGSLGITLACGAAFAFGTTRAAADTVCSTVAEFNAYMTDNATYSEDVTLTFQVTGVNPTDFHNSKGSIAQMRNTGCALGQDAVIKVYGTADTFNTAHPPGTLKLEYGNQCCGGTCTEQWGDPNASAVIFVDGSESCAVTMWNKPDAIGYKLVCGAGSFEAVGANPYKNVVDQINLLDYFVASGGSTWELPNATATGDQVCYVVTPSNLQTLTVPVMEDVTTGPSYANAVFPDVTDLAVEAGDNQAYLKFVVPPIDGKITQARLFMHTRTESFAEGSGGEVYTVASNAWSESTLTFGTKPPYGATSLGRIGPAAADQAVSLDLGAALSGPGTYSFAVVSPSTDTNGTHFFSKEGSAASASYLRISYEVVDGDGDGTPNGPDCNDADPAVHPGTTEQCNGVDDDCNGQTDEVCGGSGGGSAGGSGGGWGANPGTGGSAGNPAKPEDGDMAGNCGCSVPTGTSGSLLAALAALLLGIRRRRPA